MNFYKSFFFLMRSNEVQDYHNAVTFCNFRIRKVSIFLIKKINSLYLPNLRG